MAVLGNTQFWRHECWRPSRFRRLHLAIFVEHFRDTKINNLEHVIFGDEAVVGLDVAVDDALCVDWTGGQL